MGVFSNTWRHIRRSPYQAFAAISVMTLTFLVGGLFLLLSLGSQVILTYFEQKPQIIVFFKDTKKETDIQKLVEEFKNKEEVAAVKYVSKDQALEIYKEQFKNDPLLLEMVSADILPASIEVSAVKIENLPTLAQLLKNEPDVQEIVFPEDVVNLLVSWTSTIRTLGLVLVVFLGLVSLLTVMTVISMKIALKREEIEILKLVGASATYIKMPFILEGILYGLWGAGIGVLINLGTLYSVTPMLTSLFTGIPLFPIVPIFYLGFGAGMLIAGAGLGFVASSIALSRYLH